MNAESQRQSARVFDERFFFIFPHAQKPVASDSSFLLVTFGTLPNV